MDDDGKGLTALTGKKFSSKQDLEPKMRRTMHHGIFKVCPRRIRSLLSPLAALIFATEEPFFRAMAESVSPLTTVYFEPEVFLPAVLDFEGVDFFLVELVEATVFL